eukprot:TRINITY_DN5156_c0_g2_i1.p1 TRINITY_DN5156_c0_g2~~TRINITY_DN5156_c0_g2_i1.p1  ORF type:complete len:122 (-),score=11.31 TRINITY_DN5156_c0_g2_i1:52-417(-)
MLIYFFGESGHICCAMVFDQVVERVIALHANDPLLARHHVDRRTRKSSRWKEDGTYDALHRGGSKLQSCVHMLPAYRRVTHCLVVVPSPEVYQATSRAGRMGGQKKDVCHAACWAAMMDSK